MAFAVCGCGCTREPDGSWVVEQPAPACVLGHVGGERGFAEGVAAHVMGVGDCLTVVFDRQSRTALLDVTHDPKVRDTKS